MVTSMPQEFIDEYVETEEANTETETQTECGMLQKKNYRRRNIDNAMIILSFF